MSNADWLLELGQLQPPRDWRRFAALCLQAKDQPFSRARDPRGSVGFVLQPDASRLASMVFSRRGGLINAWHKGLHLQHPRAARVAGHAARAEGGRGDARSGGARGRHRAVRRGPGAVRDALVGGAAGVRRGRERGPGFELGLAGVPYDGPGPVHNVYGGSVAVLSSTAQRQLASWLFLRWFTGPEVQSRWVQGSNYFPVRTSAAGGAAAHFRKLLGQGASEPGVEGYPQVRQMLMRASLVVIGGADAEQMLTMLELEANRTLPR